MNTIEKRKRQPKVFQNFHLAFLISSPHLKKLDYKRVYKFLYKFRGLYLMPILCY